MQLYLSALAPALALLIIIDQAVEHLKSVCWCIQQGALKAVLSKGCNAALTLHCKYSCNVCH